jgi:transcription factor E2F7/8
LWWVATLGIQPHYLQDAVSLEHAARVLLDSDGNVAKLKTKIRRLYDIANIFGSLRMV